MRQKVKRVRLFFLAWLDPYVMPRSSASNLIELDISDEVAEDVLDSEENNSGSESDSCESMKSKITGRIKNSKRAIPVKQNPVDTAELELIKSIGERLSHIDKPTEKDEESIFGDLITSQLRKMPPQERTIAKMEISNVMYNHLLNNNALDQSQHSGCVVPRYPNSVNRHVYHDHEMQNSESTALQGRRTGFFLSTA
jgi:hypothetical protein